jgi:hypothetical protein
MGISLSLIGSVPLTDSLDVYGKFGFISWDIGFNGFYSAFDNSGEDLLYGAGLRWSIDDHLNPLPSRTDSPEDTHGKS